MMIRGRVQRSRGKSLPQTKLTSDGWIVDDLGTAKRETGTGRRWRAGWPVARVANDLRLCMHRRKKRQPAAWHGSFTTREMYTTFLPLSIPQFQNWEQFPSPPTLSEEGPESECENSQHSNRIRVPNRRGSPSLAGPTTRHRRTPEDPPRHSRDHTGRPNRARQGASGGQSL